MLIKKVNVNWSGSGEYSEVRILFYDKDGNLFESGNVISNNTSYGETENFKVTYVGEPLDSVRYPIYAVLTTSYKDIGKDSDYCYFHSGNYYNGLFTIEFKTIQPISKIKICANISSTTRKGFILDIYDICGNTEHYTGYDDSAGTIHEYDLKGMYNINKVGIVETTIDTNIQEIQTVRSMNVDYEMPDETEIRMALSNDNRNTYKIFNGSNWITIDKNNVVNDGMLPSFVNSLTENDLQLFLNGKNLDAYCTLKTNNQYVTPKIKSITLSEEKRYNKYEVPVSSILIEFPSSYYVGGRFRFYDKDDNLIESGNPISNQIAGCETDNFVVTCSVNAYESNNLCYPYEGIRTDKDLLGKDYGMCILQSGTTPTFKVEFKNPVTISKIKWVKRIDGLDNDYGAKVGAASAHFNVNYIGDSKTTKNIEISDEDCKVVENIFSPYEGDMQRYYLNEATMQTDIDIFSTSKQIMKIVDVDYVEDTDTFVRFAFTNDNSTYQVFKSSSWQTINVSDVITNGNTADEIKALTFRDLNQLRNGNGLSILVKMKTNDEEKTPIIRKISVAHAK